MRRNWVSVKASSQRLRGEEFLRHLKSSWVWRPNSARVSIGLSEASITEQLQQPLFSLFNRIPDHKKCRARVLLLLLFVLCSPSVGVCANACHAQFAFGLRPSLAATNAAFIVGIVSGVKQGTEPQICATRLHSDDQPNPSRRKCCYARPVDVGKGTEPQSLCTRGAQ